MGLFTPSWKIEAQNLVCKRNDRRLVMSDDQLHSAIKIFVSGHMKVIHDSQTLVNETKRPSIFFSRLDTLLKNAEELCQLDAIKPDLMKPSPAPQLRTVKEKLPVAIDDMIDRCWQEAMMAAASVKTEKAKQNKFVVLFGALKTFENRMYPQNRSHIERLQAEFENMHGSSMVVISSPAKEPEKKVTDPVIDVKPDIGLARALFASIQLGAETPKQYRKQIEEIACKYQTQQNICRVVVALCGKPDNVDGLELISEACSWAGADYRRQTIAWTQKLLDVAADFEHIEQPRRSAYQASIWARLGKAYEGEYHFNEAYHAYFTASMINPLFMSEIQFADLLVKMGRFDEAIERLESSKANEGKQAAIEHDTLYPISPALLDQEWYMEDHRKLKQQYINSVIDRIDRKIIDIRDKKEQGYVYKPRKKKTIE